MREGPYEIAEEDVINSMISADNPEFEDHAQEWEDAVEVVDEDVAAFGVKIHNQMLDEDSDESNILEGVVSYQEARFDSEEMNSILRIISEPDTHTKTSENHRYRPQKIFPDWLLKSKDWKTTKAKKENQDDVSEILRLSPAHRSAEQQSILVHWIMSVWQTANVMGIKKCNSMLNEFKYISYEPEENIITEGESGMTFYIIISGETAVHKAGIGVVAKLGKGKSFGELALTKGDVRTATIRTITRCEVLSLHKLDYDHFVKDIQLAERREHFFLLRECPLFMKWTRSKIDKLCNTCTRKVFEAGCTIFKQGDEPDRMYVVMDGVVEIIKEVHIECKNRWPTAMNEWNRSIKHRIKPIRVSVLRRGGYFGELAIVRNTVRAATAICQSKCTLILVDKLEFLHLINQSKTSELEPLTRGAKAYPSDNEILNVIGHISGGPESRAVLGNTVIMPNKIEKIVEVDPRAATRIGEKADKVSKTTSVQKKNGLRPSDSGGGGGNGFIPKEFVSDAKKSMMQAKMESLTRAAKSEALELAAARKHEQMIAASIEESTRHGPIDPTPLATLPRKLPYRSISFIKKTHCRQTDNAEGRSPLGAGTYAASVDSSDHVVFAPRAMLERPKGRSWTVHLSDEEIAPLVGTVTAVTRAPEGTFVRRLGSPEMRASASLPVLKATKHDILRPGSKPPAPSQEASLREFTLKPIISYRDAMYRSLNTALSTQENA